jgi:hypothetical protein
MDKIAGVIFPVPEKFVDRLLCENRNVFVKYVARTTNLKIVPGNKVVFYASQGAKELVGEGVIQAIELLTPTEALEKYGGKIFLDRNELITYATQVPGRKLTKKMLVLVLSRVKTYSPRLKWMKPITMTGQYLTQDGYNKLSVRGT